MVWFLWRSTQDDVSGDGQTGGEAVSTPPSCFLDLHSRSQARQQTLLPMCGQTRQQPSGLSLAWSCANKE